MSTQPKISAFWKSFTTVISSVVNPSVAWKTLAKGVTIVSQQIPATENTEIIPATFKVNVFPVDINDLGAKSKDVQVGYKLMDFVGQIYEIIEVNEAKTQIVVSDVMLSGFCPQSGRPALIYNETSTPVEPGNSFESRWVVVSKTCLLDGQANNTGQQEVVSKKQIYNETTQVWDDTGETTKTVVTNIAECPPPAPDPYRISYYTGIIFNSALATEITPVSFPYDADLIAQTADGYNFLFLSLPTGRPFKIYNGIGLNITNKFIATGGSDNVPGFQNNTVWKNTTSYYSVEGLPFRIVIS